MRWRTGRRGQRGSGRRAGRPPPRRPPGSSTTRGHRSRRPGTWPVARTGGTRQQRAAFGAVADESAGGDRNEVARVADVSPATVIDHFATPDLLLEAVVAARIRVLTASMFAFYERTSRWFDLLGAELTEIPVLGRAEADFRRSMRRRYAEALAGTDDKVLAKTAAGLIHPATFAALRVAGLSLDEATAVVADSLARRARRRRR